MTSVIFLEIDKNESTIIIMIEVTCLGKQKYKRPCEGKKIYLTAVIENLFYQKKIVVVEYKGFEIWYSKNASGMR